MQLQLEDGVDLDVAEAEPFRARDLTSAPGLGGENVVFLRVKLDALDRGLFAANQDADRLVEEKVVQILARVGAAGRSADDLDHFIDLVERDMVAEQDVFAIARLAQIKFR